MHLLFARPSGYITHTCWVMFSCHATSSFPQFRIGNCTSVQLRCSYVLMGGFLILKAIVCWNIRVLIISSNLGLNNIPVIHLINSATVTYLFFIYLEKKLALKYNYMWHLNQGAGTSPNVRYWCVYNFNLRGPGATSQCYPSRCYPSSNPEFNIYARQQRIVQVWLGFCGPPKWQVGRWNMLPTPQSLNGEWIQSQWLLLLPWQGPQPDTDTVIRVIRQSLLHKIQKFMLEKGGLLF